MRLITIRFIIKLFLLISLFNTISEAKLKNENTDDLMNNDKFYVNSLTILRYNPGGLQTQNQILYRLAISESNSPLFHDSSCAAGLSSKLSPSYLKIGPIVECKPIAIFNIRFGYEYINYFGLFGHLQSYSHANDEVDFSDKTRRKNKNNAYATNGHHFFTDPTFQIKIQNFAFRTIYTFLYFTIDLHHADTCYYDPSLDTLVPNEKWIWTNDTDLMYFNNPFIFGIRYSKIYPNNSLQYIRISSFVTYTFESQISIILNKPTLILLLSWYFNHPNRRDSYPTVIIGLTFSIDLLNSKQSHFY